MTARSAETRAAMAALAHRAGQPPPGPGRGTIAENALARANAYQRAMRRLREAHRDEFDRYYQEERNA